jgi:hypothetical protein
MRYSLLSCIGLLGLLASCAFPSREQAREACEEWESKEKTLEYNKIISRMIHPLRLKQGYIQAMDIKDSSGFSRETYARWKKEDKEKERVKTRKISITSRECKEEEKTNQYLGYMNQTIEQESFIGGEKEGEWKIVKHFRY